MTNNGYDITQEDQDGAHWSFLINKVHPSSLEDAQTYIASQSGLLYDIATRLGHHTFTIDKILLTCKYELQYYNSKANLYIALLEMRVAVTDKR